MHPRNTSPGKKGIKKGGQLGNRVLINIRFMYTRFDTGHVVDAHVLYNFIERANTRPKPRPRCDNHPVFATRTISVRVVFGGGRRWDDPPVSAWREVVTGYYRVDVTTTRIRQSIRSIIYLCEYMFFSLLLCLKLIILILKFLL